MNEADVMTEETRLAEDAARREIDYSTRAAKALFEGARLAASDAADHAREDAETVSNWMARLAGARSLDDAIREQAEFGVALWGRLALKQARMMAICAKVARDLWEPAREGVDAAANLGIKVTEIAGDRTAEGARGI